MKHNRRFAPRRIGRPLVCTTTLLLLCMSLLPIVTATAQQSPSVGGVTSCPEAVAITKTITLLLARSGLPKAQLQADIKAAVSAAVTAAPYAAAEIAKAAVYAVNVSSQHLPKELAGAKLVKYLVKPGQEISAGDTIAQIEVNGQVMDFKASADGVMGNTDIPVGQTIGEEDQICSSSHDEPELTTAIVQSAVEAAPSQRSAITAAAVTAAPSLATVIQNAASSVTTPIQNPNGPNQLGQNFMPENNLNPSALEPTPTPLPRATPTPVSPHF